MKKTTKGLNVNFQAAVGNKSSFAMNNLFKDAVKNVNVGNNCSEDP